MKKLILLATIFAFSATAHAGFARKAAPEPAPEPVAAAPVVDNSAAEAAELKRKADELASQKAAAEKSRLESQRISDQYERERLADKRAAEKASKARKAAAAKAKTMSQAEYQKQAVEPFKQSTREPVKAYKPKAKPKPKKVYKAKKKPAKKYTSKRTKQLIAGYVAELKKAK